MDTGTYASPMPKTVYLGRDQLACETVHGCRNATGALRLRDVSLPGRDAKRLKIFRDRDRATRPKNSRFNMEKANEASQKHMSDSVHCFLLQINWSTTNHIYTIQFELTKRVTTWVLAAHNRRDIREKSMQDKSKGQPMSLVQRPNAAHMAERLLNAFRVSAFPRSQKKMCPLP
jgi:hypothetical protein